ncbi:MAG: bifunctional alpha/beta hydrolase/OsmC family protein [Woeseiaceae bacterium]|nr:bifunctional alpha/beta hydrolase/OsmC family protein [Woeseiaceae bacterium]
MSTTVTFENAAGVRLGGVLDRPDGTPRAAALFAHCFTCSKDLKAAHRIARSLVDAGMAVLRFDFTGLGHSEGEFADSNFSTNIADLVDAARWMESEVGGPALLVGHSLGGTAVLAAAADIPSVRAVATIAAPADPRHVRRLLGDAVDTIEEQGVAQVDLGGRPFTIRRQFVDDLERHDLAADVAALGRPLMILHSPRDVIVDIDNASELFMAARHPKSFLSLDPADHLLSDEADARYAGAVLAAWAGRYVDTQPAAERPADESAVTATTPAGGFRTAVMAAGHELTADEPASVGGTGLGPSPYDLLSAALASCTTMTLQMYAKHKKLPLDSAEATVTHDKVHASDCDDCETREGRIDEFTRDIRLKGALDDKQRQRMLEIADRCPVHRTLHGEIRVRSRLVDDDSGTDVP